MGADSSDRGLQQIERGVGRWVRLLSNPSTNPPRSSSPASLLPRSRPPPLPPFPSRHRRRSRNPPPPPGSQCRAGVQRQGTSESTTTQKLRRGWEIEEGATCCRGEARRGWAEVTHRHRGRGCKAERERYAGRPVPLHRLRLRRQGEGHRGCAARSRGSTPSTAKRPAGSRSGPAMSSEGAVL